ncbi:MAG: hypothetical protein KJ822_04055 [Proteobacteria bacterium]|nr:hypothetical protein [Pseudomonadota bacterium]MBU4354504.1 hypothetical protein [Pseudomonadota bacterium]
MAILVIPHCCQINDIYLHNFITLGARFVDQEQIKKEEYPFISAIREKFMEHKDVEILNPFNKLREADNSHPVYFQNDEHLTQFGQKIVADFIIDQLKLNK